MAARVSCATTPYSRKRRLEAVRVCTLRVQRLRTPQAPPLYRSASYAIGRAAEALAQVLGGAICIPATTVGPVRAWHVSQKHRGVH